MTTAFEIASGIDTYQAYGISRVADPYSVYNSLSRVPAVRVVTTTHAAVVKTDTANFSGASVLVATALSEDGVRADRIAALGESIANGTYKVSASALADSLLASPLFTV